MIPKLWEAGEALCAQAERLMNIHGTGDAVQFFGAPPLKRLKFRDQRIETLFRKEMIASGTLIVGSHNLCHAHGPSEMRRILSSYSHTLRIISAAIENGDGEQRMAGATVAPMVRAS